MADMTEVALASPWVVYFRKLQTFFNKDPEVEVALNDNVVPCIKIYVSDSDKAIALEKILPSSVTFGNVEVFINIYPPNVEEFDIETLYTKAFEGNQAISFIDNINDGTMHDGLYVVFEPEIAQYVNDDIGDYYGIESVLYQDIAKEIFNPRDNGIRFCTDLVD